MELCAGRARDPRFSAVKAAKFRNEFILRVALIIGRRVFFVLVTGYELLYIFIFLFGCILWANIN